VHHNAPLRTKFMRNRRIGTAVMLACFCLGGCVAAKKEQYVGVGDQQPGDTGQVEIREEYFPDGTVRVRAEGRLDDDGEFIVHGMLTNYWENGQKKSEVSYVQGFMHGPRTAWYESGQIWSLGRNVDGAAEGTWSEWYPDGRKAREMNFQHGAYQGAYTEWHDNGQKRREVEFVKGKKQGLETFWDEEGNVLGQTEYVDGVPQP